MDIQKLISLVFERTALWNQAHPDHHNRHVLSKLWNEVAVVQDTKREAVQKKWKYLRDYFRAECAKIPKPRSGDCGGAKIFASSWPHYEGLKFLVDQMTNRNSSGNLSERPLSRHEIPAVIVEEETPSENLEFSYYSCEATETEVPMEPSVSVASMEPSVSVASMEPEGVEPRCKLPSRKRKTQSEAIANALISMEQKKIDYLQSKRQKPNHDEDRSFFESLMPHVKNIPNNKKLLFRNEIQQVVQRFAYTQNLCTTGFGTNAPISVSSNNSSQQCDATLEDVFDEDGELLP